MYSLEELYKKAVELKSKGMSDKEISTELHLSVNTVTWLLSREFTKQKNVQDVKIGWRSIGVYGGRIASIAQVICDIIDEESTLGDYEIYRPHPSRKDGYFSSNFASVKNKKVVIIDDVSSTGETLRRTIRDVRDEGGDVKLAVVLASKMQDDELDGVRIRSLFRASLIGKE